MDIEIQENRKLNQATNNQEDEEEDKKMKKRPATVLTLICGVCSAPAPDHLHFGAHTCYSCRAFFRRTAQRQAVKGLKRCRTGLKKCQVSDQTKNCIHCRYLKCLEIGMTPDLLQGQRAKEETKNDEQSKNEVDATFENDESENNTNRKRQNSPDIVSTSMKHVKLPEGFSKNSEIKNKESFQARGSIISHADADEKKPTLHELDQSYRDYVHPKQGTTHHLPDFLPLRQAPVYSSPHLPSSTPFLPSRLTPTHHRPKSESYTAANSVYNPMHQHQSYRNIPSGYLNPPSSFTSQMNNGEQEQENKHQFAGHDVKIYSIKKEPSLSDEDAHTNGTASFNQYTSSHQKYVPHQNIFSASEEGVEPKAYDLNRYQQDCTNMVRASTANRPSVIRSVKNPINQEQAFIQMQSDMLKLHGNLLKQTGNMFNYHANILDQQRLHQQDRAPDQQHTGQRHYCEPNQIVKHEEKPDKLIVKKDTLINKNEDIGSSNNFDETAMLLETEDFLGNTPWILAMDKYLDKNTVDNLDALIDDVLHDTLVEVESGNAQGEITKADILPEDIEDFITSRTSVIQGPEMVFSAEELNFLAREKIVHQGHLRATCPVTMYQARVGLFLGTLSLDEMLFLFSAGRKSQNYYHYMTMVSQPFFSELTTRTQNLLMRHNTQLCFALNQANYFFGHTGKTAIEQEDDTGLVTGLGDYIRANIPGAVNMPPAAYDEYFVSPWATEREHELNHRKLTKSIGESLRGDI